MPITSTGPDSDPADRGYRVIRSTVQPTDFLEGRADAFEEAITAGTVCRVTYDLEDGVQVWRAAVVGYTDPDGAHRWAFVYYDPANVDVIDFPADTLDGVLADYEQLVEETADNNPRAHDGDVPYAYTDVRGVDACTNGDAGQGNTTARLLALRWTNQALDAATAAQRAASRARAAAAALAAGAVNAQHDGKGGVAAVARTLDVSQPTATPLVQAGEQILSAASIGGEPVGAGIRYRYTWQVEVRGEVSAPWRTVWDRDGWDVYACPAEVAERLATSHGDDYAGAPGYAADTRVRQMPAWRVLVWRDRDHRAGPRDDSQQGARQGDPDGVYETQNGRASWTCRRDHAGVCAAGR